jgi:hypothetical protein
MQTVAAQQQKKARGPRTAYYHSPGPPYGAAGAYNNRSEYSSAIDNQLWR